MKYCTFSNGLYWTVIVLLQFDKLKKSVQAVLRGQWLAKEVSCQTFMVSKRVMSLGKKGKTMNYQNIKEKLVLSPLSKCLWPQSKTKFKWCIDNCKCCWNSCRTGHLWPKPQTIDVVDKYLQAANNSSDACSNKVYTPKHIESLFKSEIINHIIYNSDYDCDLKFDIENKTKNQCGCDWRESLKCQKCDFVSKYHRLHDVVDTNKRGPKSTKQNIKKQYGLITSPIWNKNFRDTLLISNMVPPSSADMQKTAKTKLQNR